MTADQLRLCGEIIWNLAVKAEQCGLKTAAITLWLSYVHVLCDSDSQSLGAGADPDTIKVNILFLFELSWLKNEAREVVIHSKQQPGC